VLTGHFDDASIRYLLCVPDSESTLGYRHMSPTGDEVKNDILGAMSYYCVVHLNAISSFMLSLLDADNARFGMLWVQE
jgi:hypothetical protein